jgi:hypothetical protein
VEAMVALSVVKTAGVLLLTAGSLLVLHILKLADTAGDAPPRPAAVAPEPAQDELRRAA